MIDITNLYLEKFGSFVDGTDFPMPTRPGLYSLQGINLVDDRLTGNGTGKSTVWRALFWALFGQTPDGLKAGDVCNWGSDKGTKVRIDFQMSDEVGVSWMMERTWKPNSWKLRHNAEFVTDEEELDLSKGFPNWLTDQLPLSPQAYLATVFLAQDEPTFLDLKAEQQAALFGEVLDLDSWLVLSRKASEKATEQDRLNRAMEAQVARLEGATEHREDFTQRINEWEQQRTEKMDQLRDEHAQLVRAVKQAKTRTIDNWAHEDREQLADEEVKLDVLIKAEIKAHNEAGYLQAECKQAMEKIKHMLDHEMGQCPTCGQEITRAWVEAETEHLNKQAQSYNREADAIVKHIEGLIDQQEDLKASIQKRKDRIREAEWQVRDRDTRVAAINKDLDKIEDEYAEWERKRNPWNDAQQEAAGRARTAQEALSRARAGLDMGYERFSLYAYWIKGFKELRLHHISEALHELEIEVNNALVELGLPGWAMRFEVDRETKKGSVQRGFSVQVLSPHTDRLVPWKSWSGGEKQRLRIAASMGLANLIRTRSGLTLPLEVWDEPTKGMSPQGVTDLLTALAHRAKIEQRVIWVVDHTAPDFGDFAGRAIIKKTRKGSQVITDW